MRHAADTMRSETSEQLEYAQELIRCSHQFSEALHQMKEKAQMIPKYESVEEKYIPKAITAPQVAHMEQLLRENIKFTEDRQKRKKDMRKEYQMKYMGFVPLSKTPSPPNLISPTVGIERTRSVSEQGENTDSRVTLQNNFKKMFSKFKRRPTRMKRVIIQKTPEREKEKKEETQFEQPKESERNYRLTEFRQKRKELYEPRDFQGRIQSHNPLADEGEVIFQEIQDREKNPTSPRIKGISFVKEKLLLPPPIHLQSAGKSELPLNFQMMEECRRKLLTMIDNRQIKNTITKDVLHSVRKQIASSLLNRLDNKERRQLIHGKDKWVDVKSKNPFAKINIQNQILALGGKERARFIHKKSVSSRKSLAKEEFESSDEQ